MSRVVRVVHNRLLRRRGSNTMCRSTFVLTMFSDSRDCVSERKSDRESLPPFPRGLLARSKMRREDAIVVGRTLAQSVLKPGPALMLHFARYLRATHV